ncbi:hypothetical protein LTR37_004966 [Vermiconidia calcicola]|uniref:Uncharacterized protein n=1 Tax=Vermiconidia calcicola TaxID=1690605 RepID=A0ACC3NKR2_9PEZI|nr:hypothetical protein LTR37_004966 [Vermiconidia calcicola]
MPAIRIRKPFAASFVVLLLISAYLGLSTQKIPSWKQSDKGLHFITFFLLTLTFYWILETSRRRCINLTLLVCTAGLAIGSEVVQALLPNGRSFDPFDIVGNVIGSALALLISSWYHKRMLERRRKNKHYDIVPGEEPVDDGDEERDVELGTVRDQETGVVPVAANGSPVQAEGGAKKTDVSEELDNWDENAEDWDEEPAADGTKSAPDEVDSKKRVD